MGYLSNYKRNNIANGLRLIKEETVMSVRIDCLHLVSAAYKNLMADEAYTFHSDETTITAKIFGEIEKVILKGDFNYSIIPDPFEYTEDIIEGRVSTKKARKYDLVLENWDNKNKVKFGVEAKLLVETKHKNKRGTSLVKEYVSEAGMGKYIKRIYKRNGVMVGYVLEGSITKIISNINAELIQEYGNEDILASVRDLLYPLDTYLSTHTSDDEDLLLYHLMLDFNSRSGNN